MSDRSNVGERVLGARQTTQGNKDALENIVGHGLHDGAQCYVIAEQASYRFVATSELPADGRFVVAPLGKRGRWVRESGLVGFAMLEEGKAKREGDGLFVFTDYAASMVTQFEVLAGGLVKYVGIPPRLALLYGSAAMRLSSDALLIVDLVNQTRAVASGHLGHSGDVSAAGMALLVHGDTLALSVRGAVNEAVGSLRIVLT